MGVKSGGDGQELRLEFFAERDKELPHSLGILRAPAAGLHGHVDLETLAFSCTSFLRKAGPGVQRQRMLMQRHVEHAWVLVEYVLSAVAVVGVEVQDEYSL